MHTLNLLGGTVVLYDSPYKLPESRRVEHDFYKLIDSGIGSSLSDIDRHFEPFVLLIGSGDIDAQTTALNNLRYLFFHTLHKEYSPKSLAFATLVYKIDEQLVDEYDEESLKRVVLRMGEMGLTQEHVNELLPVLEKKF